MFAYRKPPLMAAVSLALLAQGALAAEEQFFPIVSYRVGPYGANGQSFYGGFVDYLNYVTPRRWPMSWAAPSP